MSTLFDHYYLFIFVIVTFMIKFNYNLGMNCNWKVTLASDEINGKGGLQLIHLHELGPSFQGKATLR